MGFTTFVGRVLFSAVFFFGVWLKYADEEMFLQALEPKLGFLRSYMSSLGVHVPECQLKYLLTTTMVVQGLGGILFLFGSSLGAYLMLIVMVGGTPLVNDFYSYDKASPEYARQLTEFLKNLSITGALLFFLGMKNQAAIKSKRKVVKVKAV